MKNRVIKVEGKGEFITIHGTTLYVPTFNDIIISYNAKDEFRSFDEYEAYRFLKYAYIYTYKVIKYKYTLTASGWYERLLNNLLANYKRDLMNADYADMIRKLENTRKILTKEYAKTHDADIKFLKDRTTDTINSLNKLFTNNADIADGNGDGHDLYMCAYTELWRAYRQEGLLHYDEKNGKTIAKIAMNAVNDFIYKLKRNYSTLADDDDEKIKEAMDSVPYIEHAIEDIDNFENACDIYNLNKRDAVVCKCLIDGDAVKDIAVKIERDEKTVYKIISKIRDKITHAKTALAVDGNII